MSIKQKCTGGGGGISVNLHAIANRSLDGLPLVDARQQLQDDMEGGATCSCPCCGQTVKLYRRTITSTMARGLIALYRVAPAGQLVKLEEAAGGNGDLVRVWRGDFTKLRFWNFIATIPTPSVHTKDSNTWSVTPQGESFVRGAIKVARYVYTYLNTVYGFSTDPAEMVTIQETLATGFSYRDLMNGTVV